MRSRSNALARFSPILLYSGVAVGMYVLSSGWAAILGYHLAICLSLWAGRGWPLYTTLVRGWSTRHALPLIALCLGSGVLVALLWPLIRQDGVVLSSSLERLGLTGWSWLAFMVYYSFVNPWLEELYWRSYYPSVVQRRGAADLFFAGYHLIVLAMFVEWPWMLVSLAVLWATSHFWRLLARRRNGLGLPVAAHMAADLSIIIAVALLALGE